jgi:ribosomal protein S18 acetylase RimI-like enzyme
MGTAVTARRIEVESLPDAIALLSREPRDNLLLLDLTSRIGLPPPPGEMATELVGAFRDRELVGVATLRPTIAFDARIEPEALEAILPLVEALEVGLVKSDPPCVDRLWSHVSQRRRHRVWVDRFETCFAVDRDAASLVAGGTGRTARRASEGDLEPLVFAARESLREEDRPDPFAGDVRGFRRWVRGRMPRARVVESEGQVRFVGYADVQRREGWLLQGIYTWPDARRRGFAAAGTSALCREAFASGADHVQLAVVDGNDAAHSLYEGLGFKPFGRLRTILFT